MTSPSSPRPEITERSAESPRLADLYHLVLLDDNDHTYEYVVDMLGHVFGYGKEKAFAMACMVDSTGRATVETAAHEQVLRHQRQIHAYGADPRLPRSAGSMSAIIEPAM
jgi:ATP-dependent Clp protease adaptor protein ClpS